MWRAFVASLLAQALRASGSGDGRDCGTSLDKDKEACAGARESEEGELSSLLQRKHSVGGTVAKRDCPIPSDAVEALRGGLNAVFDKFFTDQELEHPKLHQTFSFFGCKVTTDLEASLSIAGLSSFNMTTFECNGGECLETTYGECSKWRADMLLGFTSNELTISGFGDANYSFDGECYFLSDLPDIPSFATTGRIEGPAVELQLRTDFSLTPPGISNSTFAVTSLSYRNFSNFECGLQWWPKVNRVCNDYIQVILDKFRDMIVTIADKGIVDQAAAMKSVIAKSVQEMKSAHVVVHSMKQSP